jgi:RNA-directed DNA polymerase
LQQDQKHCSKTRNGKFVVKRKTQAKRLVRKLEAVRQDLLDGVIFNYRALRLFKECVVRLWRKTLGKRSQKGRMTWASFTRLLIAFPLPEPVIQQAWHR